MAKLEIAVVDGEGRTLLAQPKPRHLIAFHDAFHHNAPESISELAWLAYNALGGHQTLGVPLDTWVDGLDDVSSDDAAVAEARQAQRVGNTPEVKASPPPTADGEAG